MSNPSDATPAKKRRKDDDIPETDMACMVGEQPQVQVDQKAGTSTQSSNVESSNVESDGPVVVNTVTFYDMILVSTKKYSKGAKKDYLKMSLRDQYVIFPNNLEKMYTIQPPLEVDNFDLMDKLEFMNKVTDKELPNSEKAKDHFLILDAVVNYMFQDDLAKTTMKGFKKYCEKEGLMEVYAKLQKRENAPKLWSDYMVKINKGFSEDMKNGDGRYAVEEILNVASIMGINERPVISYNIGGGALSWINNHVLHYNTVTREVTPNVDGLKALKEELHQFPTLPISKEDLLKRGFTSVMYVPDGYLGTADESDTQIVFVSEVKKLLKKSSAAACVTADLDRMSRPSLQQTWKQALRGLSVRDGAAHIDTVWGICMHKNKATLMKIRRVDTGTTSSISTTYHHYPLEKHAGEGAKTSATNFLSLQFDILKIVYMETKETNIIQ